jgi:nitroreductase
LEVKEAIFGRRSIRKYTNQKISKEDIVDILEAGCMAPSAVNYQPWYFVAVQDEQELKNISAIMTRASEAIRPALEERFAKHPQVVNETTAFIRILGNAPLCVLAFYNESDYKKSASTLTQSVAAAIENMLLAAYEKGIGSCWMTVPLETNMDTEFCERYAKGKGEMVAMITFGYPDQEPKPPKRKEGRYQII